MIKFIYSKKATKFSEIFPLLLTAVHTVKSKGKISQNFVAFSEYMNFDRSRYHKNVFLFGIELLKISHKQLSKSPFCISIMKSKIRYKLMCYFKTVITAIQVKDILCEHLNHCLRFSYLWSVGIFSTWWLVLKSRRSNPKSGILFFGHHWVWFLLAVCPPFTF